MWYESRIPVQYNPIWHAKYSNHVLQKQICCLGCSDVLMHRCQYNSLGGSVYYFHDAVEPMWHRQAKYKVHGIVTEPSSRRFQWLQKPWWALGVVLNPLTRGVPWHICIHVLLSYDATRLAAVEPTAFSQPPSAPPMHCHAAHKVQFCENHCHLVVQAPQNQASTQYKVGCSFPPHNWKCPSLLWACTIKGQFLGSQNY